MSPSSSKKVILLNSDGETFEIEEAIAVQSQTIKHMIEDDCADTGIPLPNVSSKILPMIIQYCKKHVQEDDNVSKIHEDAEKEKEEGKGVIIQEDEDLKKWDADFINEDQAVLYDLLLAVNYLNVKGLLELAVQRVADMIKGKTPEQIRETFNIKNDFTSEEEEEIRKENAWAFQ